MLVDRIRSEEKRHLASALSRVVADDGSDVGLVYPLALEELPRLVTALKLCDDSVAGPEEVALLVEECNQDGDERLEKKEAVALIGRIVEAARVWARMREDLIAKYIKLSKEQVFELRLSFAGMARGGVIGTAEVAQICSQLTAGQVPAHEDVEELIEEAPKNTRTLHVVPGGGEVLHVMFLSKDVSRETPNVTACRTSPPMAAFSTHFWREAPDVTPCHTSPPQGGQSGMFAFTTCSKTVS